jgi:two-component system catabolic regulation response regulator CreB
VTRVLVVEDEPAIAESLGYALRRDGYAVEHAPTVARALEALASAELVLLDLMLPDGSGFEIIGRARRLDPAPAIIVLSSRDDEADRVAALETGADDYVTKPFSPREIVARVRAVLRRAGTDRPAEVRISEPGDRVLETHAASTRSASARAASTKSAPPLLAEEATRRASVRGRAMELTRVEFDLLACMLAAPGRVFTRAELIDRIWGDGFAITDRTIDSHVKALRRKVEAAGGDADWIETVRGVGYRVSDAPSA